ncbi:MAG: hypothetical protein EOP35_05125 [Rubrivivax sp.]|nr:MAG: hypothetical protein EOP35_05125 [Rubrivivax sp.]
MRTVLFIVTMAACAMGLGYGVLGTGPISSVLAAIWTLIAVVAIVGRGVLDAMLTRDGAGADPSGEPGDRGGARMPGWLK